MVNHANSLVHRNRKSNSSGEKQAWANLDEDMFGFSDFGGRTGNFDAAVSVPWFIAPIAV